MPANATDSAGLRPLSLSLSACGRPESATAALTAADEVRVQMPQGFRHLQRFDRIQLAGLRIFMRVDEQLQVVAEQPAEAFEDAAVELRVVLLVENLREVLHAHRKPDAPLRVAE